MASLFVYTYLYLGSVKLALFETSPLCACVMCSVTIEFNILYCISMNRKILQVRLPKNIRYTTQV